MTPSSMASMLFIGLLGFSCLAFLWLLNMQPPAVERREDEAGPVEQWLRQEGCFSGQAVRLALHYLSLGITVISLALIFGTAIVFLGGRVLGSVR